jgi:small-conductance mechanosensitive channel
LTHTLILASFRRLVKKKTYRIAIFKILAKNNALQCPTTRDKSKKVSNYLLLTNFLGYVIHIGVFIFDFQWCGADWSMDID